MTSEERAVALYCSIRDFLHLELTTRQVDPGVVLLVRRLLEAAECISFNVEDPSSERTLAQVAAEFDGLLQATGSQLGILPFRPVDQSYYRYRLQHRERLARLIVLQLEYNTLLALVSEVAGDEDAVEPEKLERLLALANRIGEISELLVAVGSQPDIDSPYQRLILGGEVVQ